MVTDKFPMTIGDEEVLSEHLLLALTEGGAMMDSPQSVRFLVIHCSATRCNRNYTEKQLVRDHKARGFRTAGYHYYCRKDGTLTQFRKLLEVGAHARPYNRCSIGICYEGGLDEDGRPADTLTADQYEVIRHLLMKLKIMFPRAVILGHRDLPGTTPKECPCFDAGAKFQL
jgi:N-acetylmuramoyl-L-alanine amidase